MRPSITKDPRVKLIPRAQGVQGSLAFMLGGLRMFHGGLRARSRSKLSPES